MTVPDHVARPGAAPAVACTGLVVRFGATTALDGVDLVVRPGELVAVTGHSGAGKSTLLSVVAGIVTPDAGEVLVDGRRVGGVVAAGVAEAVAAGVALIPQGNGLAAMLTARENVLVPLLARGVAAAHAPARADAALDAVGLGEVFSHLVEELSGGQQQRVAVARALALDCRVLLADEPTSELDHTNREVVLRLLRARASQGAAVVMATHDPEAAAAADRVVHLDDGVLTTP
ncbi:ABC transporter ATP-binding protein [Ornithinibacter aureus]|jgi:putative ABC transport system ATP-binding protein|uniref:ABC transporter ATP-binding protein n=1 Tax=Ornithinibacter aureus TaxID=622664 RepID=A0ABP8JTV3_9MICO|nr:ATP-binding cassette domain-containing protein [Ornithinibacter aureus]KAF0833452.1 putative ABC transport system ATP-binding protein [Ornithinibacter aureus]HOB79435.1 ATP-binding cassette domain-containing protein [Ornithinibacter sp.]HQD68374.1 ATP-binding cassette domain-containing protein [Ornithinibacter sp.]